MKTIRLSTTVDSGGAHWAPPERDTPGAEAGVVLAVGYVVLDGVVQDADSPAGREALTGLASGRETLPVNGSFAAAVRLEGGRELALLADPLGSYPLYYSVREGTEGRALVVGCDTDDFSQAAGVSEFDRQAVAEMLLYGYALDGRTILEGVREAPSASRIVVPANAEEPVKVGRYWEFGHEALIKDYDEFAAETAKVLDLLAGRYASHLRNQEAPPLIKLTAGGDSRLLLALYHEAPRVHTATYGARGSRDTVVARSLSRQLGASHTRAPLTGREAVSEDAIEQVRRATGLRATCHTGLGSVAVLRAMPSRPHVHLPGHAGDFAAGSHIRPSHLEPAGMEKRLELLNEFHLLKDWPSHGAGAERFVQYGSEVRQTIVHGLSRSEGLSTWAALYRWDLENRQHRYILSDAAVLRRNGPVLLPYWDLDFVRLFSRTDVSLLQGQAAYLRFMPSYIESRVGGKLSNCWPVNHHSIKSALAEAVQTGDLVGCLAYGGGLAHQAAHLYLGVPMTEHKDRYTCRVSPAERARLARQTVDDPILAESLTDEGRRHVLDKACWGPIGLKALLDAWRRRFEEPSPLNPLEDTGKHSA